MAVGPVVAPVRLSCDGSSCLCSGLTLAVALWCGLSGGAGCAVPCCFVLCAGGAGGWCSLCWVSAWPSRPPGWQSFGAPVFNRRRNPSGIGSPCRSVSGPWRWSGVVLLRRGAGPPVGAVLRLTPASAAGPAPSWSFSVAVPVLWWAQSPAGSGPCCRSRSVVVLLLRGVGPPVGTVLCCQFGPRSGAAISQSNRDFSAPYTGPKISSDFSGEVFYARGLSLVSWYINAPYSPPRLVKIHWEFQRQSPPQEFPLSPFSPKTGRKFWAKIIPHVPPKGGLGNGFGGIDGGKIRRYDARQAQAKRPRPSEPAQAVQEGGRA